jgi:hypothetical protein
VAHAHESVQRWRRLAVAALVAAVAGGRDARAEPAGAPSQPPSGPTFHPALYWYDRVGGGGLTGASSPRGITLGLGARYERRHLGLDVSVLNLLLTTSNNSPWGWPTGSLLKVLGLVFVDATAPGTPYLGPGLSLGRVAFVGDDTATSSFTRSYAGAGAQGELVAGYEHVAMGTARVFVELEATLPLYRFEAHPLAGATPTGPPADRWGTLVTLSIGVGLRSSSLR